MTQTYYRKGFGLKKAVAGNLTRDYHSTVVEQIQARGYRLDLGDLTIRLAKDFGFCYGVDRAVEYAYQSRQKFPDRRIFLVGEIIHNPHVNQKLESMGVSFLYREDGSDFDFSDVRADDVVIIPAFGATAHDFHELESLGCVLVDTTCGSVLNVWKRVERYARNGFTAIIHGKAHHEETRATASQVAKYDDGRYLIVRDMAETEIVCEYIERGGDSASLMERFGPATSPGFEPDRDLERIGVANQTTMLAGDSLAIGARLRVSLVRRHSEDAIDDHFMSFDTICSATQERQDAVIELIEEPLDVMVVMGGYNSSNTAHLATICQRKVSTYHVADAACIDPTTGTIRHQPVGSKTEETQSGWLASGSVQVGITAGASTPNNLIGQAVERICAVRGIDLAEALRTTSP